MSSQKNRRRRSLVWVNVLVEDKLKRAISSEADCIVMDLEDTLPISQKDEGRLATAKALKEMDFRGKEKVVRINGLDTPYALADLEAILPAMPDAIRLPKCERVEYVLRLDEILSRFEAENGLEKDTIGIILMLETPMGILNSYELASCCKRIWAIGIGLEDLTTSMQINRRYELKSQQLLYAKQKVVMAGRAAGVQVLDSSTLLNDPEFILADCIDSRDMGFDGRSMVNVEHTSAINQGYSPSKEEIDWANHIIKAYQDARENTGEPYYNELYVDIPVVTKAEQILLKAQ